MNTIKLGSKGDDVKVLQKYLGINPDGDFGPKTLLKVKEWQKSKGLTPDGIMGELSYKLLFMTNQERAILLARSIIRLNDVGFESNNNYVMDFFELSTINIIGIYVLPVIISICLFTVFT